MIQFRRATTNDHALYVRYFAELGVDDPIMSNETWERENLSGTFFLDDGNNVVGYGFIRPLQDDAHVVHVVVDPEQRGRGLGKHLMPELAKQLRHHGCKRWRLNVKADNEAAIRLYKSVEFEIRFLSSVLHFPWNALRGLREPQQQIVVRAPRADEDAALEATFDLTSGFIEALRCGSGNVVLCAFDGPKPAAVARFSPGFPGASPFRVASPDLARPLLEAMRSHALTEHDGLQLMVENHATLTQCLLSAGARLKMEILHMRGKIPREQ